MPANVTRIAAASASEQLAAVRPDRQALMVFNDADMHLKVRVGGSATATDFSARVAPGQTWDCPAGFVKNSLYGVWDAGAIGAAQVTEELG